MEADLNPHEWLKGSACVDCNPYVDVKATQYENICQLMHSCFHSIHGRIFDDVFELCGGTAKVSVLMIQRRHYN
eukprot:11850120-Prorocentrum_lima.AAC.1